MTTPPFLRLLPRELSVTAEPQAYATQHVKHGWGEIRTREGIATPHAFQASPRPRFRAPNVIGATSYARAHVGDSAPFPGKYAAGSDNGLSTADCGNGHGAIPSNATRAVTWWCVLALTVAFWWPVFRALGHVMRPVFQR